MSLDCDFEEIYDRPRRDVVSYLVNIGEARQILTELANHDVFDTLSKHNEYWDSEYPIESDKLDSARLTLKYIESKLLEALEKME